MHLTRRVALQLAGLCRDISFIWISSQDLGSTESKLK